MKVVVHHIDDLQPDKGVFKRWQRHWVCDERGGVSVVKRYNSELQPIALLRPAASELAKNSRRGNACPLKIAVSMEKTCDRVHRKIRSLNASSIELSPCFATKIRRQGALEGRSMQPILTAKFAGQWAAFPILPKAGCFPLNSTFKPLSSSCLCGKSIFIPPRFCGSRRRANCQQIADWAWAMWTVSFARGYLVQGDLDDEAANRLANTLLSDSVTERTIVAKVGDDSLCEPPDENPTLVHVMPKAGVMDPVAESHDRSGS